MKWFKIDNYSVAEYKGNKDIRTINKTFAELLDYNPITNEKLEEFIFKTKTIK
jgi:hypothetical protein